MEKQRSRNGFARHHVRQLARMFTSAVFVVVAVTAMPSLSSAQDIFSFLWGGGSRAVVPFSPAYAPGQIIVSFGDRKLYWVHRKGEAISYPIAVPREQSRWSGVTTVSHKA